MNKKRIITVLWIVIAVIVLLTTTLYLYYQTDKPMMAIYCAMAGVMLVFNFILSIFLINKNFKDKQ